MMTETKLITIMLLVMNMIFMPAGFAIADSQVRRTVDSASQIGSGIIGLLFILFILGYILKKFRRKASNDEFSKFMARLQPGENDLMINNQWGVPLSELDKKEAANRGFIKWNHRWVTKEDLRTLKPQYRAYRGIRWIAIIIYFLGIWALIRAGERFQSFPTNTRETIVALSLFLYPVFHFVVGYNLQRFKNWARWVAVILFPLLIPPRTFYVSQIDVYAYQRDDIFQWIMIVTLFFVFILVTVFSKTGKVIFASKKEADSGSES
jgi:putative effector of murein hydrolase LrgA (UPF0299 family)